MKKGKIVTNDVKMEMHEWVTVEFLMDYGYDIELIRKSNKYGVHTPDICMDKLFWEMKAPKGEGKSLMKNTLQKAVRQSENVIIDLRRVKRYQMKCLAEIKREFDNSRSIKRIKIITKSGKMIELSR